MAFGVYSRAKLAETAVRDNQLHGNVPQGGHRCGESSEGAEQLLRLLYFIQLCLTLPQFENEEFKFINLDLLHISTEDVPTECKNDNLARNGRRVNI